MKKLGKLLHEEIFDLVALLGAAAVVYGIQQYSAPAAWIVAGALLLIYAVLGTFDKKRQERTRESS